jgi:large subunit ribosomal protein L13
MPKDQQKKMEWKFVDCAEQVLGRLSTRIAYMLRGKDGVGFRRNIDRGCYVVAVNASKIMITGSKKERMRVYSHTGYIGNLKEKKFEELKPEQILNKAIAGMMPKNKLSSEQLKRLKIYSGNEHPHANIKFREAKDGK